MAKFDPARQTGMGLWTDANEMLEAAKILADSRVHKVLNPAMYLLGHAIELSFKSFLLSKGMSHESLKTLGHNLHASMQAAIDDGLSALYEVTDVDKAIIEMLNPYYQGKEFEYRVTGFKKYPATDDLIALVQRLLTATEATCRKSILAT